MTPGFEEWLATRPPVIKQLAAEFPLGTTFMLKGRLMHLLGYNEGDLLIISPIDPAEDYDGANEAKEYLCAKHMRNHELPREDQ